MNCPKCSQSIPDTPENQPYCEWCEEPIKGEVGYFDQQGDYCSQRCLLLNNLTLEEAQKLELVSS